MGVGTRRAPRCRSPCVRHLWSWGSGLGTPSTPPILHPEGLSSPAVGPTPSPDGVTPGRRRPVPSRHMPSACPDPGRDPSYTEPAPPRGRRRGPGRTEGDDGRVTGRGRVPGSYVDGTGVRTPGEVTLGTPYDDPGAEDPGPLVTCGSWSVCRPLCTSRCQRREGPWSRYQPLRVPDTVFPSPDLPHVLKPSPH